MIKKCRLIESKYNFLGYLFWNIGFYVFLLAHSGTSRTVTSGIYNLIMIRAGHLQFSKEKSIEVLPDMSVKVSFCQSGEKRFRGSGVSEEIQSVYVTTLFFLFVLVSYYSQFCSFMSLESRVSSWYAVRYRTTRITTRR